MTFARTPVVASRAFAVLLCLALVPMMLIGRASKAFAAPVTVTVIVESILEVDNPEGGLFDGECWGDYVFDVNFGGSTSTSPEFSIDPGFGTGCIVGHDTIPIGFAVTRTVDTNSVGLPLSISVHDVDVFDDDTMDVSPVPGQTTLQLAVDPWTGTFAPVGADGDPVPGISFPGGVTAATIQGNGDGERSGLNLRIVSTGGSDTDGDGLLDAWETAGFDADGNGTVDVNLPAMGANPSHKDLFLELDTANGRTLGRDDIRAMKDAFAAAPRSNPDGTNGINMHVDTGTAVDPSAREGQPLATCNDGSDNGGDGARDAADPDCGAPGGSGNNYLDASTEDPGAPNCGDGVDNDGDGQADANDSDCLVGDNLGGGNAITTSPSICNLNGNFYTTKLANFAAARLPIFRYAISTPGSAGCTSGGQAEIGGNDFVDHNGDGGTIMHELGHTLALRHGGFEDKNCKPNLVSVMSYFSQFGVSKNGGGVIIDYAPPRQGVTAGARSTALEGTALNESSLPENAAVDATDPSNQLVFTNGNGATTRAALNGNVDWNGDGAIATSPVSVNVDTSNSAGRPGACTNSTLDTDRGANEWFQVSLPFRQNGDSATGALNPTEDDEPMLNEIVALHNDALTTDTGVTANSAPVPVAAGAVATVNATVTNHGPNASDTTLVGFSADPRFTPTALPANCAVAGPGVQCGLGSIAAGQSVNLAIPYVVAADTVYNAGAPINVPVQVSVTHAGPDSNVANDHSTANVNVVAVADLAVNTLNVTSAPPILVVGEPAPLDLAALVSSGGPSSPMDAKVTFSGVGTGISATTHTTAVTALRSGVPQTANGTIDLTCTQPGVLDFTVTAAITPSRAPDSDNIAANNTKTIPLSIECLTPVAFNIRPGSTVNEINLGAGNLLTVVVTSSPGEYGLPLPFDATKIDPLSVRFGVRPLVSTGGGTPELDGHGHRIRSMGLDEELPDNDVDMGLHFDPRLAGIALHDTEACVRGRYTAPNGTNLGFFGCDKITVVPNTRSVI